MDYFIHVAILASIWGILALSLELVVGETGLVSLAHAAFFGIGAYATAILLKIGLNFFFAAPLAMAVVAAVALAIGLVLSRFKGDIYMLASLGFTSIVYSIFLNWQSVTNGPLGLPAIPRASLFGFSFSTIMSYFVLVIIMLALVYAFCRWLTRSSFGRVLHAIREDEEATSIFGYRTTHYKLLVFVIAAMLAALAGGLYASYISFIDPSSFMVAASIFVLATIILGGLGNVRGAILGAFILIMFPEALRFVGFPADIAAQSRQLVYGLVLILLMLFRPQGIWGTFRL